MRKHKNILNVEINGVLISFKDIEDICKKEDAFNADFGNGVIFEDEYFIKLNKKIDGINGLILEISKSDFEMYHEAFLDWELTNG